MKKFIILSLVAVLLFTSCVSTTNASKDAGITTALVAKDYVVLGTITKECTIHNVLGLFTWGGAGYVELKADAKAAFPEMDEIIDVRVDNKTGTILGVYNTFTDVISATVIKYVD